MRRALGMAVVLAGGALAAACASAPPAVEQTNRGPLAAEMQIARSFTVNGREPSWDEKRQFEDQMEEKVFKYLREHPDIQNEARYSSFRFWRQVTIGSTKEEVKVLLEDPDERTIDITLMASLSKRHWSQVQKQSKEAWVYPLGWVLYFDDKAVVGMIRTRQGTWYRNEED